MAYVRDAFVRFLRANGLRVTRGRMAVLDAVARLEWHFSRRDLFEELQDSGVRVHRATVYRALPLIEQAGIIRQVHFHDAAEVRYEHDLAHRHHDHLRCLACNRVIEINRPSLEAEKRAACREHDFEPVDHRFWAVGYCKRCRGKLRNAARPASVEPMRADRRQRVGRLR